MPLPLDPRRTQLRRMKIGALLLLGLSLGGFGLSHAMGGQGVWAWVRAFCEAATVGALADWFAVVALFRHPLGLPFPHTAIIASNKNRLGHSLATFVRDNFLEPDQLLAKLRVFDPAARLGKWLSDPAQVSTATRLARTWARQALDLLDERAVRQAIEGFVLTRLRAWNAGHTAGEVLGLLTRDGRHQALLDEALSRLGNYLAQDDVKTRASALMVKFARKEWPRIVGTVNIIRPIEGISDSLADRLAHALLDELQEVLSQPDHPLRHDYEAWVLAYIDRLREDESLNAQVEAIKQKLIDHPEVKRYVQGIWDEVNASLKRDLASEDSALGRHLTQTLTALGQKLGEDEGLRKAINEHILSAAHDLATNLRSGVTDHIEQTVSGWDERQLVDELELSVGRDLQYIRYNGTLVGGVIGLILHAVVILFAM